MGVWFLDKYKNLTSIIFYNIVLIEMKINIALFFLSVIVAVITIIILFSTLFIDVEIESVNKIFFVFIFSVIGIFLTIHNEGRNKDSHLNNRK